MSKKLKARQASEIWGMLDNLSQNDPVAYRKFIKEQMELGKSMTAPPEPKLLIRASIYNCKSSFVYISLCSWSKIPKNQSEEEPINVIGGEPYEVTDKLARRNDSTMLYPVAFSESLMAELLSSDDKDSHKQQQKQLALIDLSIDYIKSQRRVNINTDTMYEICDNPLVGTIDSLYSSFRFKPFDAESELKECLGDPTREVDLLREISHRDANGSDNDEENPLSELRLKAPRSGGVDQSPGKMLIEEIAEPQQRAVIKHDEKERRIRVEICVPARCTMGDLELDISQSALHLEIAKNKSFEPLHLPFTHAIDVDSCVAQLRRKSSLLVVTARLV